MSTDKKYLQFIILFAASLVFADPVFAQQAERGIVSTQWRGEQVKYVKGKVSVKLKDGVSAKSALRAIQPLVGRAIQEFDELGWGFFELPSSASVLSTVEQLEELPDIQAAHPVSVGTVGLSPNDNSFANQWALTNTSSNTGTADADIDADLAWDLTTGSSDVVIAVLDTGIPMQSGSLSHPDLDDPNKIIMGPDYTDENDTVKDENGHGTHVAGIAAAESNNSTGISGVCWNCKVLVIQTNLGRDVGNLLAGQYTAQWFYNAVKYAADYKTNNSGTEVVINFSSGGVNDDPLYHDAIEYARDRDVLMVSIAHNDNGGDVRYPAALSTQYSNMVAVSATDHNDNFASYSNSGPEVNVAAPGGYGASDSRSIYSTLPDYATTGYGSNTNYGYSDGTSMAAPHVAGTAALMLSIEPSLTPSEVRDGLEDTAQDVNGGGFDNELGHGRINTFTAVDEAAKPAKPTNLTITNAGQVNQHPNLDWDSNTEPDLDHYNVYRCKSYYISCTWQLIAQPTNSSYTDIRVDQTTVRRRRSVQLPRAGG